ncbi:MAG: Trehalose/maltose import ATP-binding protein MalK [Methanoregula sp. PtaU1.Bin051]|nr:MAG: Trehalose/maltose import ATP-binding protein MalK [Methanoregula sp. PtaU1.Bin051]
MDGPVIEVANLTHSFKDTVAVNGISFSVKPGEIFSFLGPNGAGKSTTINVLTTLLALQQGTVRVAGHDVASDPEEVRRAIGIVFQEETLDRDLTVWEILEFHGRLYSMPHAERRNRIDEMIRLVELELKRDVLVKHLSGGMKRRLEIARGLMTRPKVLFLDEPTLGLDPQSRIHVWDYIRQVNREGTTIFLTTHYMDEADSLSDRISIIDHGRIIASGTSYELKNALGQDIIYIETADDVKTTTVLRTFSEVKDIRPAFRGLSVIITTDGTKCLPAILDRLKAEGIEVMSANLKKPTLDDVFVHFTGREIRG